MKRYWYVLILCMVLALSSMMLVACDNKDLGTVDMNSIVYDNSKISWTPLEGVSEYGVKFNDDTDVKITSQPYINRAMKGDFKVTVFARKDKKTGTEVTKEFFMLPNIDGMEITKDGKLTWFPVDGADGYKVRINGKDVDGVVTTTEFSDFVDGKNSVQVKAVNTQDNAYFANWSDTKNITIVPNPTNIKYDGQYISWSGSSLASAYEVYINDSLYETVTSGTRLIYDAQQTSFDVKVRSIGDHKQTFDAPIPNETKPFVFLTPVSEFFINSGTLSWTSVADAVGYKVEINGTVQNKIYTEPKLENIPEGRAVSIRVMPISEVEDTFTDWSITKEVFLLAQPVAQWNSSLNPDGVKTANLYWDAVPGAAGYGIEIIFPDQSKHEEALAANIKSYEYDFMQVGEYKVSIKALAEKNTNTYDSSYSKPVTVVRLAAPKRSATEFITSNAVDLAEGVVVNYDKVSGATGYRLYKDGNRVEGGNSTAGSMKITDIISKNIIEEQNITYSIQSIGSISNGANGITATLDSLSAESLSFNLTVLAMPQNAIMEGYTYKWDAIANNDEYAISVDGDVRKVTIASSDLSTLTAGTHPVKVCSAGNGAEVLPSWYTAPISVRRIAAPTGIKIATTDASEGRLEWTKSDKAKSYTVSIGQGTNPIDTDTVGSINDKIATTGTAVSMYAVANYYNELKTEYYMTSRESETVQFVRLEAIELPTPYINNNMLVWNPPSNLVTSEYTPTYRIYDQNNLAYNGQNNGTSMDLSDLDAGTYTFRIKCIGDGVKFINSDLSKQVSITKLDTPEVRRGDGFFEWNGVPDAKSYKVFCDGESVLDVKHTGVADVYKYTPTFKDIKTYDIKVIAVGDNGYDTVDSKPFNILQKTKQLATPKFTFGYSAENVSADATIDVNISEIDPLAMGYIYDIGGVTSDMTTSEYHYNPKAAGSYKISVYAVGGKFGDVEGEMYYYLDSRIAGGTDVNKITLLDVPNKNSVQITRDGVLSWANVTGAVKYEVVVAWDGGIEEAPVFSTTPKHVLQIAGHSSCIVKIRAVGNDRNIITSDWITYTNDNLA